MTKRKRPPTVGNIVDDIKKVITKWLKEGRNELAAEVGQHSSSIVVRFYNKSNSSSKVLTDVQKKEIRDFFEKLAELFNLKTIARNLCTLEKKLSCHFECRNLAPMRA